MLKAESDAGACAWEFLPGLSVGDRKARADCEAAS
jgi:hypothetical protein